MSFFTEWEYPDYNFGYWRVADPQDPGATFWETTYKGKIFGQWVQYTYKIKKAYRERERGQRGFVNAMG